MNRNQLLIILLFAFVCPPGDGQEPSAQQPAEDPVYQVFLNCTVLISKKITPKEYRQGTGFLVERRIANPRSNVYSTKKSNRIKIFLVTSKHVLPEEGEKQSITIRVNTQRENKPEVREIKVPIIGDDGKYLSSVRVHHKNFDVAAVDITSEVIGNQIDGAWLPYDIFITKEKLRAANITVGDEVFMFGYPAAIYDPRNIWPILRKGIISTVPSEGYAFNDDLKKRGFPDQIDGFLIDANVFPGSSGSPVILVPQSITRGTGGNVEVGSLKNIPYLLGIVSKSIPMEDLGYEQRMGLGIVYSADTIRETIEQFFQ